MSTANETQPRGQRRIIYVVSILLLAVFVITGLVTFHAARTSAKATDKANQLVAELEKVGVTAPPVQSIVGVLGEDGGAVCADPNTAISHANANGQLTNGAANVGVRPVIAPATAVQGQLLIMQVYCPDEVADFQAYVDGLNLTTGTGA